MHGLSEKSANPQFETWTAEAQAAYLEMAQRALAAEQALLNLAVRVEDDKNLAAPIAKRPFTDDPRYSDEWLNLIFEDAPDAYYLSDLGGTIVDVNKAMEALMGYSRAEFIGKPFLEGSFLTPEQKPLAAWSLTQSALGRKTGPAEFILNRADGSQVLAEIRTVPLHLNGQTLILTCAREVAAYQPSETDWLQSEAQIQSILHTIHEGIIITNLEDEIIFVNQHFCMITGYDQSELIGKQSIDTMVAVSDRQPLRDEIARRNNADAETYEFKMLRKDQTQFWVRARITFVSDANGNITHGLSLVSDITDSKDIEVGLMSRNRELEALNELITALSRVTTKVEAHNEVARILCQVFDVTSATICRVDAEGGMGTVVGRYHSADATELERSSQDGYTFQLESDFPILANWLKNPVGAEIVHGDNPRLNITERAFMDDYGIKTAAMIAIEFHDKQFGLAFLWDSKKRRDYSENELWLMKTITKQIEILLANFNLHHDIQDREMRYHDLVENAYDLIQSVGTDGKFLYVNEQWVNVLGYSKVEAINLDFESLIHPEYRLYCHNLFQNFAIGNPASQQEIGLVAKDGRLVIVEGNFNAHIENGVLVATRGILRDITGRKAAETAYHKTQENLRSTLESLDDMVFVLDRDGVFIDYYTPDLKNFIIPPEEFTLKAYWDVLPPKATMLTTACIEAIQTTGETQQVEYTLETNSGTRWFSAKVSMRHNRENEYDGVTVVVRDITQKKESDLAILESEEKFRQIFESSPVGMVLSRLDGITQQVNQALCDMLGYSAHEMIGHHFKEFTHPDDIDTTVNLLEQSIQGGIDSYTVEKRYIKKDGNLVYAILKVTFLHDSVGEPMLIMGQIIDITRRMVTEEALRTSEEQFRDIFENAPIGMSISESDGTIIAVNPALCDMYQYSREELEGNNILSLTHPDDLGHDAELLTQLARGEMEICQIEKRIIRKNREMLTVLVTTTAHRNEAGRFQYFIAQIIDISERKQAEEELLRSRARLAETQHLAHLGSWEWAIGSDKIFWSSETYRIYGVNPSNFDPTYQTYIAAIHPDDQERVAAAIASATKSQGMFEIEHQIVLPSGEIRTVWEQGTVHRDAYNKPIKLAGAVQDITERKRIEENEREQRILAVALLNTSMALSSTLELGEVLDRILDNVRMLVPYDMASIALIEDKIVRFTKARRLNEEEEPIIASLFFPYEPVKLFRQMIETRNPIVIPDTRQESDWHHFDDLQDGLSYIGVPIFWEDTVIGLLNLESLETEAFTTTHAVWLTALASQAAIAIKNAQLYKHTRDLAIVEERQRIARDLHDAVSQTLFSASVISETLPRIWENDPEETRQLLGELHQMTRGALAEMRTLLVELRPSALVEAKFGDLVRLLVEALAARARLNIKFDMEGERVLPPDVQVALYRITQEIINNIAKHARSNYVMVQVSLGSQSVRIAVEDDGRGFDLEKVPPQRLGLGIMRERAAAIGANFEVKSHIGQGTKVIVTWLDKGDEE